MKKLFAEIDEIKIYIWAFTILFLLNAFIVFNEWRKHLDISKSSLFASLAYGIFAIVHLVLLNRREARRKRQAMLTAFDDE